MCAVDEMGTDERECDGVTSLRGVAQTHLKHAIKETTAMTGIRRTTITITFFF